MGSTINIPDIILSSKENIDILCDIIMSDFRKKFNREGHYEIKDHYLTDLSKFGKGREGVICLDYNWDKPSSCKFGLYRCTHAFIYTNEQRIEICSHGMDEQNQIHWKYVEESMYALEKSLIRENSIDSLL